MKFIPTCISSVLALVSFVNAYADPEPCSGICNDTHDPSLIRRSSDGTYFRFATGGGVSIHTAPALTGPWTYEGEVMPSGSSINNSGSTDVWAPDVHLVGTTYYLYYAVSSFGTQDSAIGLATSTTMDVGTWTDHGSTGVSSSSSDNYNAIDPNLIAVGSAYYLNFGSFWSDIFQVPMANPPTTSAGTPYNIAFNASGTHAEEGSYMFYYEDFYYLFFSRGICCNYNVNMPPKGAEYSVKVCRSSSPTGGFVDESGVACTDGGGTVVLASHGVVYGPGGQGVYNDPTYGPVLYYHYVNTTIGYEDAEKLLGWNKITWSNGWPTV